MSTSTHSSTSSTSTSTSTSITPTILTRTASRTALTHIIDNILKKPCIKEAFTQTTVENVTDFLRLDDQTIDALTYDEQDSNNVTITHQLRRGEIGMIKSYIHYVHYRNDIGNPIGNDWLLVTSDMLGAFRTDLTQIYKFNSVDSINNRPPPVVTPPTPVINIPPSVLTKSVVDLFKHGIKRDFASFPTLKDDKQNDQRHHTLASIACAQEISDVLNPNYKPATPTEIHCSTRNRNSCTLYLKQRSKQQKGNPFYVPTEHRMTPKTLMQTSRTITLYLVVLFLVRIKLWNI
jgi:hypothetical protein